RTDRQAQDAYRDWTEDLPGDELRHFPGGRGGAHFHRSVFTDCAGWQCRSVRNRFDHGHDDTGTVAMSGANMRLVAVRSVAAVAALLGPTSAVHAVPSTADDRIALIANGTSLTNTNGGGGVSAGWLHNFDADTLVGLAAEYQALSVSHWAFASLNGAM